MPLYHATHRHRLESIFKEGLHDKAAQNFDCERGVYLADSPIIAFGFLIEDFFEKADESASPKAAIENFVVLVIDESRFDRSLLEPDHNTSEKWQKHLFIYRGTIDVTGMPVLDADILFPDKLPEN